MSNSTRSQTEQQTSTKQPTPSTEANFAPVGGQLDPVSALQRVSAGVAVNPTDVLMLQRTIGNRAVQGLLAQRYADSATLQRKNETATTKEEFIKQYKTWLEERLGEVNALTGDAKVTQARAFLAQIESVSVELSSGKVPSLDALSKTPTFQDNATQGYVPHELIGVTRKFILITEQSVAGAKEDAGRATEGSRYEAGEDWNSRMGVPQYRTQSDNLAAPEATCNVTSFAMVAERLGYSRDSALQAIDTMLKESYLKTEEGKKALAEKKEVVTVPDSYWQEKAKKYLETVNSESKAYRQLRGGKLITIDNALVKAKKKAAEKEAEKKRQINEQMQTLASDFKANAQLEDLLDFMTHLMGISRTTITSSTTNAKNLADKLNGDATETHTVQQIYKGSKTLKEIKASVSEGLSKGGAAVLSIYHKGTEDKSGTHIVSIQSVTDTGIVVDDPYGKINPDYRSTNKQDAYAATGKSGASSRTSTYKNKLDNTAGDWKADTAQTLTSGEALGNSYEISDDILKNALNYVTIWSRPTAKTP